MAFSETDFKDHLDDVKTVSGIDALRVEYMGIREMRAAIAGLTEGLYRDFEASQGMTVTDIERPLRTPNFLAWDEDRLRKEIKMAREQLKLDREHYERLRRDVFPEIKTDTKLMR